MKRKLTLLIPVIAWCLIASNIMFTGCTKEGPAGPPGADGKDGLDANATCMECHNFSEFIVAKFGQQNNSVHASGANIDRNGENCAYCHTSQGFRNYITEGSTETITSPTAIGCRTCHPIHESYTADDYSLRTTDAVALTVGDATYDFGNSNLCTNCHQARPVSPYPVFGGEDVEITNMRYGPHYGPQSNMFVGAGPYEVPGDMEYQNSAHTSVIDDGCITCHMSDPVAYNAGGHQMGMTYASFGSESYNLSGCTECHPNTDGLEDLLAANSEEIETLTYELRDKLIEKGLLNASELVPTPITVSPNEAGAILNYKFVYGDHSKGAHNYLYTKALLMNTLESLN
jgi:hypothetical protein